MATTCKFWCNNCYSYRSAWDNDYRRCWTCDRWSLSGHCCHGHGCCGHGTSEALKNAENRNSNLSSENTRLHNELSSKSTEIGIKSGQLVSVNNELTLTKTQLTEAKGELTTTRKELKDLGDLFKNLEIESNDKDREIEIKNKDIKNLKGEVEKFQEEDFNRKFKDQEEKLDEFVNKLGISRQKYRDLLKFCQQSIRFSENYNQDKIDEAEEGIEAIKDELLSNGWLKKGVSLKDVQELCSKCKEFARLKVEKGKKQEQRWRQQQEQYEARQEVPPRN